VPHHRDVPTANRRFAKAMRQSMTTAEFRLWQRLRKPGIEGCRFRRQAPVGPFIVDFLCPQKRLIVELDGDQHGFPVAEEADAKRTEWLRQNGYVVIRFWNNEVMNNIEGVCEAIWASSRGEPSD
jgi:very-short-patch-repair endonuclease